MVLFAATCWGLSGTASQVLFQHDHFHSAWLVTIRMLFSGIVLVIWGMLRKDSATRALIRQPRYWPSLLLFSVVGLLGVQYTYFKAIAAGNAASATLLQYLGPPMIVAYTALSARRSPSRTAWLAMALALLGTILLVTGGHFSRLAVPWPAVVWGIASALCLAFYTLYPTSLLRQFDSIAVVGWGMTIGGIASLSIGPVWTLSLGQWSLSATLLVGFVVLLGTLAAFSLFLASLHYLTPPEAGLLASAEPVSAVLAALMFLHVHMDSLAIAGAAAIVMAIIQLSRSNRASIPRH